MGINDCNLILMNANKAEQVKCQKHKRVKEKHVRWYGENGLEINKVHALFVLFEQIC